MKAYINIHTNETVYEDEAEKYVKEKLGINVKPVGRFGTMTLEQEEFISNTVDWYFSGDWVSEEVGKDEDIPDLERDLEIADMVYQDNLERKWGVV